MEDFIGLLVHKIGPKALEHGFNTRYSILMKKLTVLLLSFLLANLTFAQSLPPSMQKVPEKFSFLSKKISQIEQDFRKIKKRIEEKKKVQRIDLEGVENFYRVSDALYRGAEPTEEGYKNLAKLGIKTIVSLQLPTPKKELIKNLGMTSRHIPINPLNMKDEYAKEFLSIVSNPQNHPVYVHCLYGSDRTGTMVALYRIYVQHWPKDAALEEMRDKKYGFREIFVNLKDYIRKVDIPYLYTPQDRVAVVKEPSFYRK